MTLYSRYLVLALNSLPGSSHPLLLSSYVITNPVPVILDSHELYNHYLTIKIIIYLLNIFPCVTLLKQNSYNISDSDKSRKDSHLPPRQSICFVKPVYVTEEEFKQLKQTALASPTPHQVTRVPTLSSKPLPIPPTISDAVPFTGADEGNVHSTHSLPFLSFD
ncbi:hypothetical protein DSO57_1008939 [Entomophthora muscae]|uniref:Uncharacterized protein n=1 Tax=Entomophthora muscae TaxID=34485 RepID=A0ACC2U4Z0_9FUNG|nr:hypothetical protein DSO57_1008939 [Entomophthora muscae]